MKPVRLNKMTSLWETGNTYNNGKNHQKVTLYTDMNFGLGEIICEHVKEI
jgi:hypothetical protein